MVLYLMMVKGTIGVLPYSVLNDEVSLMPCNYKTLETNPFHPPPRQVIHTPQLDYPESQPQPQPQPQPLSFRLAPIKLLILAPRLAA